MADREMDHFSKLMFGHRAPTKEEKKETEEQDFEFEEIQKADAEETNYFEEYGNMELFEQMFEIMASLERVKPLLKEISPLFLKWLNK
ncbi:hypothetical protein HPB58_22020 [Priestia filamentosa]|uniref:hypothetical protein n=1 Tax=Priestia filamentosa TaxID=1402861 RepID=UPI001FB36C05|nr:hypothetical protein [Priestia filamentosa]MED3726586.1 hypothetical protein [Priestia filamentosa]UOE59962.1 hypothetical protein HPB58_22020 [Priestia filamentosa]